MCLITQKYDTLASFRLRIDSFSKATIDAELLALREEELRMDRLEKERLVQHLKDENIYKCSQFDTDRKSALNIDVPADDSTILRAAHNDYADDPEEQALIQEDLNDMETDW